MRKDNVCQWHAKILCEGSAKWIALCAMLLFSFAQAYATVWSADNIQMVHLQDRNRYVCDPDGLMSAAERDSADSYLRKLQTECGVQTVFIVVNNVKGADCFRMAEDVGNKYGVGDKKNRRGLVVVVAVKDRRYFIAPGKGLEGDLTDVECDDIAQRCIVKFMKINDIDMAVLSTVKALYSKFKTGNTGLGYDDQVDGDDDGAMIAFILTIIIFGYPAYLFIRQILEDRGIIKPRKKKCRQHNDDDWFPPFIFGGGGGLGSSGGGCSGGSFGGGSFGGGGAGGGW